MSSDNRPPAIEVMARLREALHLQGWTIYRPPKANRAPFHFRARRRQRSFLVRAQASAMSSPEILGVQQGFAREGETCLWLLSQPTFPVVVQLPALWLSSVPGEELRFPSGLAPESRSPSVPAHWSQVVTAEELAAGISAKTLWYGTARAGDELKLAIDGTLCRCDRCAHVDWYPCRLQLSLRGAVVMSLPPSGLPRKALELMLKSTPYRVGRARGADALTCMSCSKPGIILSSIQGSDSKPLFDPTFIINGWEARTLRQLPTSCWHI